MTDREDTTMSPEWGPEDQAELQRLGRRLQRVRAEDRAISTEIRPLIVAAALADVPQETIATWIGMTRAAVAAIEREGGVPPRRPGRRKLAG